MALLLVALVDCVNSKPTFLILGVMIDTQEFRWIHFYIETELFWKSCLAILFYFVKVMSRL